MTAKYGVSILSGTLVSIIAFLVVKAFVDGQDTSGWSTFEITGLTILFPLVVLIVGIVGMIKMMT